VVEHPTDELAAYSIGTLEADVTARVAEHLRTCASCRTEVEAYEETAWRLAEAVAQEPPARMRAAVVERARAERPVRRRPFASLVDAFRRPVPAFIPAALVLALIAGAVGYAGAVREADRYATSLAAVQNARITALAPSAERPQARGALVQPAGGAPYLLLDLPATPADKTWQAWVIRGGQPLPAGISQAPQLTLTVPLQPGDVVAVTLESSGGASQPTTTPVLTGKTT
jgi:hypothetical protein